MDIHLYLRVYILILDMAENRISTKRIALVTGSSSGIGFETFASMRNMDKSKEITDIANKENLPLQALELDVTDDRSVDDAINNISPEKKSIEVVVNNVGYGLARSVEDSSLDEIKTQVETN